MLRGSGLCESPLTVRARVTWRRGLWGQAGSDAAFLPRGVVGGKVGLPQHCALQHAPDHLASRPGLMSAACEPEPQFPHLYCRVSC